jgi:ubiquitin C-terminal hydrolase
MNIGQTCYMSSVLQCLAHTEPIKNLFLSQVNDPASKHNTENSCTTVIQSGTLTKVFREFICQVWQNQQSTFNPQDIKRVIGNLNERFKGSNQEDAQEFLSYLIKGLHDELNEVNEKKYINMTVDPNDDDEVASNKLWDLYHKRENSKIVGIFYGQIKTSSQCPKCPYAERRFEVFSQLILPVSHGDEEADVEQCLKQFMSNEETEL